MYELQKQLRRNVQVFNRLRCGFDWKSLNYLKGDLDAEHAAAVVVSLLQAIYLPHIPLTAPKVPLG